jgi:hypothetical protein
LSRQQIPHYGQNPSVADSTQRYTIPSMPMNAKGELMLDRVSAYYDLLEKRWPSLLTTMTCFWRENCSKN